MARHFCRGPKRDGAHRLESGTAPLPGGMQDPARVQTGGLVGTVQGAKCSARTGCRMPSQPVRIGRTPGKAVTLWRARRSPGGLQLCLREPAEPIGRQ